MMLRMMNQAKASGIMYVAVHKCPSSAVLNKPYPPLVMVSWGLVFSVLYILSRPGSMSKCPIGQLGSQYRIGTIPTPHLLPRGSRKRSSRCFTSGRKWYPRLLGDRHRRGDFPRWWSGTRLCFERFIRRQGEREGRMAIQYHQRR